MTSETAHLVLALARVFLRRPSFELDSISQMIGFENGFLGVAFYSWCGKTLLWSGLAQTIRPK